MTDFGALDDVSCNSRDAAKIHASDEPAALDCHPPRAILTIPFLALQHVRSTLWNSHTEIGLLHR
jgi:hypothetical protein